MIPVEQGSGQRGQEEEVNVLVKAYACGQIYQHILGLC